MPFKIYTYADPYHIHKTDFWKDIKYYPHLCASRTMVRGLISTLPDEEIQTLICPLDAIVNNQFFEDWAKNISRRIKQYSEIGRKYRELYTNKSDYNCVGEMQYEALTHNKNSMLDALRLFIELGVSSKSLEVQGLNFEHKLFVKLLEYAENSPLFSVPRIPGKRGIIECFIKQAEKERDEKIKLHEQGGFSNTEKYAKELDTVDKMIHQMNQWDGNNIVVHGVHQFTPLQLRLLTYFDKLGMEVIFLHNYLPEYKEIYSSWDYIYQQFDAPIHHDENIETYQPSLEFMRAGKAIASNMALLCEENIPRNDRRIVEYYKLYMNKKVLEFENISEYAGYVSDLFSKAESEVKSDSSNEHHDFSRRRSTREVLEKMKDVIYTTNKDVDDLLQVYHPDYARNRHFLAYPVGQFFVALYRLWNTETREIDIDYNLLRDCVNSGMLTDFSAEKLLNTLINVEPFFNHITGFSEFNNLFMDYHNQYIQVSHSNSTSVAFPMRMLNIYSSEKVSLKDIDNLHAAVRLLNKLAEDLFGCVDENDEYQFGNHFERLKEFVDKKQALLANEEEKDLVSRLLNRLEIVQKQLKNNDGKGTLEDLRSGLYFFLKQKEEPISDWFVRNFEQIDGDVLLSKKQSELGREKIYHFACVSDMDMNRTVNELLPWPLSEMFIEKAYTPKELPFQVYYASLGERSNFLRYALFYGLYFSQCETKISYVKQYGDNKTDCYEMLKLIGLKSKPWSPPQIKEKTLGTPEKPHKVETVKSIKYEQEQAAAMFFCPYRFFIDYVLNPHPTLSGTFLMQKFYVNVLIENTWKAMEGKVQRDVVPHIASYVNRESSKIERFFPFFISAEIIDLKRQAENYISTQVIKEGYARVRTLDYRHMQLKKTFGNAEFYEDFQNLPEKHKYAQFEQLVKTKNGQRSYSAHSVPKIDDKTLSDCILNYLNYTEENLERAGTWCMYCPEKGLCLSAFGEKLG